MRGGRHCCCSCRCGRCRRGRRQFPGSIHPGRVSIHPRRGSGSCWDRPGCCSCRRSPPWYCYFRQYLHPYLLLLPPWYRYCRQYLHPYLLLLPPWYRYCRQSAPLHTRRYCQLTRGCGLPSAFAAATATVTATAAPLLLLLLLPPHQIRWPCAEEHGSPHGQWQRWLVNETWVCVGGVSRSTAEHPPTTCPQGTATDDKRFLHCCSHAKVLQTTAVGRSPRLATDQRHRSPPRLTAQA